MRSWPDWLYRLSARDEQTQPIELVHEFVSTTLDFPLLYTVPVDRLFLLESVTLRATPAAAETITTMMVTMQRDQAQPEVAIIADETDSAAGVARSMNWQGQVVLGPRYRLLGFILTGGTPGSSVWEFSFHGVLIPRGANVA